VAAPWTIRSLLAWIAQDFASHGLPSARLDAELLISFALTLDRVRLYMDLDRPLAPEELARVRALVVRRRKREPIAYIVGQREFYRRSFEVTSAVLIPRPDTETLVERALELLPEGAPLRVLDLCTGSGALAVTLAAERPQLALTATDLSAAALDIARRNAERHGVTERIVFVEGDLFAPLPSDARFELIVANPPYIPVPDMAGLQPEIRLHEPALALESGPEGLDHLGRLSAGVQQFLAPGGRVLFEVGQGQAAAVIVQLTAAGMLDAQAHQDLGKIDRVVEAVAPRLE
jgi:release factor glutamine methyltransferase